MFTPTGILQVILSQVMRTFDAVTGLALTVSEAELRGPLVVFDIDPSGLSRDDWLDLLMTHSH